MLQLRERRRIDLQFLASICTPQLLDLETIKVFIEDRIKWQMALP